MRLARKIAVFAVGTTSALALSIGGAGTASAHDARVKGPYFCGTSGLRSCGHGGVTTGHTWVWACDDHADGHGYRVQYKLRNGRVGAVGDGNGNKPGCGNSRVTTSSNPVVTLWSCDSKTGICQGPTKA
ncbi:hypothetical protein AB8O64_13185 [Streptomyces sp. QH1-20]|uniref:hypothetical protein n=1 Tax=Streptomyces sp. QH1-20 TaxID=3240934 RepID=UPI0035194A67